MITIEIAFKIFEIVTTLKVEAYEAFLTHSAIDEKRLFYGYMREG